MPQWPAEPKVINVPTSGLHTFKSVSLGQLSTILPKDSVASPPGTGLAGPPQPRLMLLSILCPVLSS